MALQTETDPRDKATRDLHAAMANARGDLINLQFKALAERHKDLQPSLAKAVSAQQSNQYKAQISYAGVAYAVVTITIRDSNDNILVNFTGHSGGAAVGVGTVWGSATIYVPPQSLKGQRGRFVADFYPFTAAVSTFDMNGPLQCAAAGGGLGFAVGIVGGEGTWG